MVPQWFNPTISREEAICKLNDKHTGVNILFNFFLINKSNKIWDLIDV